MTRAWATWTGIAGLAVDAVLAVVGWLAGGDDDPQDVAMEGDE